jgi:6-phosphogluconolactonase
MIEKSMLVYIGTYTNFPPRKTGLGEGIYIYRLSLTDGALTPVGVAAGVANPSFLTVDTVHHRLFAVNEVGHFAGEQGGGASAFSINPQDGTLNFLNAQPTHGGATCYISLDHTKKWALVSNYSGGNIAVLPILPDGRLGAMTAFVQHVGSSVNADRQQTAYAHSIIMDPTDRFALAADLGMDKIMVYKLDHETGQLMPNSVPWVKTRPGSGPRHMAFNAKGDLLYVAHELDSTVSVFRWDSAAGVPAPNQAGVPAPNQVYSPRSKPYPCCRRTSPMIVPRQTST